MESKKVIEIVSEECPHTSVIENIFNFLLGQNLISSFEFSKLKLNNVVYKSKDNKDEIKYTGIIEVSGFVSEEIGKVIIRLGRGKGSFVDYVVFMHESVCELGESQSKKPIAMFEVTKTSDSESRNSASFQRMTKKVIVSSFPLYEDVPFVMLYMSLGEQKTTVSQSRLHADRISKSINIQLFGAPVSDSLKFVDHNDFIRDRQLIPPPRSGQQVNVYQDNDGITISIRLIKSDPKTISHDPNIGYCLGVIYLYREYFKYTKKIKIINHGYVGKYYSSDNKLGKMLLFHNVQLDGVEIMKPKRKDDVYFKYDTTSEKNATIYLAIEVMNQPECETIFENHAGSERGYLTIPDGSAYVVPKKYSIPDLVFVHHGLKKVFITEGKIAEKRKVENGISQLDQLDDFTGLLNLFYPDYEQCKGLALIGSTVDKVAEWTNGKTPLCHITSSGDIHTNLPF